MRGMLLILLTVLLTTGAMAEEDGPYLFDQLKKQPYKAAFKALFQGQSHLEPWLATYIRTGNGVDIPGSTLVINGLPYSVHQVCQPHNCPGNVLYVLFAPAGQRAYALFTKDDGSQRFFGKPEASLQEALLARTGQ